MYIQLKPVFLKQTHSQICICLKIVVSKFYTLISLDHPKGICEKKTTPQVTVETRSIKQKPKDEVGSV